jgi:zinc resistance-associated protein
MGYGPGYRGHMMDYGDYGDHMMGYGPWADRAWSHNGYYSGLSDEETAKLDSAREAFFNDTRELRNQIQDKRFDLRSELNKEDPDTATVTLLQKELSKLDSEFDQKSIEYQLKLRKILPEKDLSSGFGPGFGGGYCW